MKKQSKLQLANKKHGLSKSGSWQHFYGKNKKGNGSKLNLILSCGSGCLLKAA